MARQRLLTKGHGSYLLVEYFSMLETCQIKEIQTLALTFHTYVS